MKIADILRSLADIVEKSEQESHIGTQGPFTQVNQPCDTCQQTPCACATDQPDAVDQVRQLSGLPVVAVVQR